MTDRLLIVDDEPEFAQLVARVARSCGYEVTIETDSARAVDHLASWAPTHMVLDLSMPRVDGVTLLRRLAEERCKAKVVVVSGYDGKVLDTARRIGIERGLEIAGTFRKPVRMGELRDLLLSLVTPAEVLGAQALERAMDAGELLMAYQPKVGIASGKVHGFEALLRWRHPVMGAISPVEAVGIAERSGLIDTLTTWVASRAVAQLAEWQERGLSFGIAVNISALNLRVQDFPEELEEICRSNGVEPGRVSLEVTETVQIEDLLEAMDLLARLRLKGFELSLDDFGTGHSTLVQLHRLPFTELKIDRQFVSECAASGTAGQIVRSTVDLCRNLELRSVAEGVEDEATMASLCQAGCDLAQGYFVSRPMAAAEVPLWVAARSGRGVVSARAS